MALTMLMLPCILFSLAGAMAPEYFPPAAPSALAKLRDIGKSIRANDNNSVLGDLIKGSRADLEQELLRAEVKDLVYKVALARVAKDAATKVFAGGCTRNFTGCPLDWNHTAGACSPPPSYAGPCRAFTLAAVVGRGLAEQTAFAANCRASWPCRQHCKLDFRTCPLAWQSEGNGLCFAPADYVGKCSPVTDFSDFSVIDKARWSATCYARWPCMHDVTDQIYVAANGPLG